ncbi:hypothetical protein R1sor_024381 [Riccia sorocarpa]|uniref:Uncharacterized protein n=1 Tax=Riccia sorocarpa TaxID=122646 RepID=A0ABD3GTK3_9MARC
MDRDRHSERAGIRTANYDDLDDTGNGMEPDADWTAGESLFSTPIGETQEALAPMISSLLGTNVMRAGRKLSPLEGARRSSDFFGGEPAASNCRSSEFKRKRTQQNIPEVSRKLENDFGCPVSYDSTPPNSPINLSASGSSPGSDSQDSTDFSPIKLRPRKFNFSPPRLLPALTTALSN